MSLLAALVAGLALSQTPAPQGHPLADLSPQNRGDLQCLTLAVVAIGASDDNEFKAALTSGATYFYGRLQGRQPGTDWLARLAAYARTEPLDDIEANRERCIGEVQAMGAAFTAMGESMGGEG